MTQQLATANGADILERVVVGGDLSKLSAPERLMYYRAVCESVGLNPLTRPFDYITLNGRLTLYAKRDATDQLRKIHGVSIKDPLGVERYDDLYVVTAVAVDKEGRTDSSKGAVSIAGLKGEALANAVMKAETKAKRRVTLSLCGLGLLDETEIASVPDAVPAQVDVTTGEVLSPAPPPRPEPTAEAEPDWVKPAASKPQTITGPQAKRLFAIAHEHGWEIGQLKAMLLSFGFAQSADVRKDMYEEIVAIVEKGPQAAGA